jgi:hypothetical protein
MRDGGLTPDKAFNGSASTVYYRTPTQFFDVSVIPLPSHCFQCCQLVLSVVTCLRVHDQQRTGLNLRPNLGLSYRG